MMPNDKAKRVENNHDELNLGQILFMLPTEIKNKIRKLEKAHNVFINNKYGIIFNEKKVKSSMVRSLPVENLLSHNVGSIINYLQ